MKREQAVRIQDHIFDAYAALDDARLAIAGLGKEERLRLDDLLWEVIADVQQKLLAPIYDQYPDLEPPLLDEQIPSISSELSWDQVRLPPSVTESDLDGIIFSVLRPLWQKTAMVVILAIKRCKELEVPVGDEVIAARLQVLADSDRIEGIGDLRMWFHSEVQLKQ
jgi:hypothetical protein